MNKLKINKSDLELVFDAGDVEVSAYLDRQTGEVIWLDDISDDMFDEYDPDTNESLDMLKAAIQADDMLPDSERNKLFAAAEVLYGDSERYIEVPRQSSREGYADMEGYIETLEDEHLRELLEVAINGKGAFWRFKDVLFNYPEAREVWFTFSSQRIDNRMVEWLAEQDIEPEFQ